MNHADSSPRAKFRAAPPRKPYPCLAAALASAILCAPPPARSQNLPPEISIADVAATEPLNGSTSIDFPVTLSRPAKKEIFFSFSTRDSSANSSNPSFGKRDYTATTGTVIIPPNTPSGTVRVIINPDLSRTREPAERFTVTLSEPSNGLFRDKTGRGIIRDITPEVLGFTPVLGTFQLTPARLQTRIDVVRMLRLTWTLPPGLAASDLASIDVRLRDRGETAIWLRWDQSADAFTLVETAPVPSATGPETLIYPSNGSPVGLHAEPGSETVLATPRVRLHAKDSRSLPPASGGTVVALELAFSFTGRTAGRSFRIECAAAAKDGSEDAFVRGTSWRIKR